MALAACYWCDCEMVMWMEWTIHEVPGDYGGGQLVSIVGVCQDHAELIADVDSVVGSTSEFS